MRTADIAGAGQGVAAAVQARPGILLVANKAEGQQARAGGVGRGGAVAEGAGEEQHARAGWAMQRKQGTSEGVC